MTGAAFSDTLVERLARARHVTVLTGAGVSAESGIATFRDPDGLWARFRPEELANVDAFLGNPERVQGWYAYRRRVVHDAAPNAGHHALADMETMFEHFSLVTQNVDDLHRRAGSTDVIELHGNLTRNFCIDCRRPASADEVDAAGGGAVRCPACGGLIRPDVVWFGEMLSGPVVERAWQAASASDVFLSVGTSAIVYPAAELPLVARRSGAYVAELNTEPSALADAMDEVVLGPSGQTLPALLEAAKARLIQSSADRPAL